VKGTSKVRQSPKAARKPAIRRPGKCRGHILDALDALEGAGSEATITDEALAAAMNYSRPRDLFRRKRPGSKGRDGLAVWWIDAGIITREAGIITRAADWRERLDDIRRAGREIDAAVSVTRDDGTTKESTIQGAESIARVLMDQKRKGYRDHLAGRRGQSASEAEPSEASAENVRRSRAKRDEHLARKRERQDEAREAAREREKRQRVERLVREGMARRFAEADVHIPQAKPANSTAKAGDAAKMPPKVNGEYKHGPLCDCWLCDEEEGVA